MMFERIEQMGMSYKRAYQLVSTTSQPSPILQQSINQLLIGSLSHPEHLSFLLHRINWFQYPFLHYRCLFFKMLRLYQSRNKRFQVTYNILIEAFFSQKTYKNALSYFMELFHQISDKKGMIAALRNNYPHKLCPIQMHQLYLENMIELAKNIPSYRTDFIEIIAENLSHFDTQLIQADYFVHKIFPNDTNIIQLRKNSLSQLAQKFDILLSQVIKFFMEYKQDANILYEIFVVFQQKILPIKTTKLIQFLVFIIAQENKQRANKYVGFLLSNIFDQNKQENWYRIFTQSNFYLHSFVSRSKKLSNKSKSKILTSMIQILKKRIENIEKTSITQEIQLNKLFNKNQTALIILQTIILIKLDINDDISNQKLKIFNDFIQECKQKLHFQYFLKQQILELMKIEKPTIQSTLKVKFSNKFLPSTLPKIGELTDEHIKMNHKTKDIHREDQDLTIFEPIRRKLHKGQTPISYCSQTII